MQNRFLLADELGMGTIKTDLTYKKGWVIVEAVK